MTAYFEALYHARSGRERSSFARDRQKCWWAFLSHSSRTHSPLFPEQGVDLLNGELRKSIMAMIL
jgi:hypothetical protein